VIDVADNGEDAACLAETPPYDPIVLDVMLPGRDGWSIVADLRRKAIATPILFLTARDAMAIVILGGLFSSTVLTLLVLPALALRYARFERRPASCVGEAADADGMASD
jgi:CheY-like chemotaxis protein